MTDNDVCRYCAYRRIIFAVLPNISSFVEIQLAVAASSNQGPSSFATAVATKGTKPSHVRDTIESILTSIGLEYCCNDHAAKKYPWARSQYVTLRSSTPHSVNDEKATIYSPARSRNSHHGGVMASSLTRKISTMLCDIFGAQARSPPPPPPPPPDRSQADVPVFTIAPVNDGHHSEVMYWLIRIMPLMCDSFVITTELSQRTNLRIASSMSAGERFSCCKYSILRNLLGDSLRRLSVYAKRDICSGTKPYEATITPQQIEHHIARSLAGVTTNVCAAHQTNYRSHSTIFHVDCTLLYDGVSTNEDPFVDRSTAYNVLTILRDVVQYLTDQSSPAMIVDPYDLQYMENWENVLYWLSRALSILCDTFSFHLRPV